jgi:hypothetical protein
VSKFEEVVVVVCASNLTLRRRGLHWCLRNRFYCGCGAGHDRFLYSTVLPLLVSNCLSPTPNDPSKPYTHRHERYRCPRRAQHARQEAG